MSYRFETDVPQEEYLKWLSTLENYNITQTPMWANVKTDWKNTLCVLYDNDKPVAGALLLIRRFAPGLKMIYSPRGFVLDYSNIEVLSEFTSHIKIYAKKIGACVVRIDPEIILSCLHENTVVVDQNGKQKMEYLSELGYRHQGFDRDFHAYTQPRYNAEISLVDQFGNPLTDEALAKSFDKKIRKFIGHYTDIRGIFFEYDIGENAAIKFSEITSHTEGRQHIVLRNESYFKKISDSFGSDNVFFFAKLNIDKLIEFLKEQIKNGDSETSLQAENDLDQAELIKEKHGHIITMSALLTVKSNSTAYLLYSGFDDTVFPRFRTTNQLRFEAMRYFRNTGCKTFSLLGIHGDLNDSLSEFKMKFNPTIVEYAGEFELPIKKYKYWVLRTFLPIAKRIFFKIKLKNK